MGMFDYIRCEMPLPETPKAPKDAIFQTKDTPDQYLTIYTITADGKLSWRPYTLETVPENERPYPDMRFIGMLRRVEGEPETLDDFHGDLIFYEYEDSTWWEYRARFTDGVCGAITLVEYRQD